MRANQVMLFVLFAVLAVPAWSATSCIQNKGTATYKAAYGTAHPQADCVLPELLSPLVVPRIDAAESLAPDGRTVMQPELEPQWELRVEDGSIYAALKRWSAQVGWQISWEIPVDFPVEIVDVSTGPFEESVRRVLTAFKVSDYPPYPCFHENKVIRIVRRIQGNDDECH